MYYSLSETNNLINIYNSDYSLYKTISVTPLSDCKLSDCDYISSHIFNNDNNVELLIQYWDTINYTYYSKLIDENGTELYDFGECAIGNVYEINNTLKYKIHCYNNGSSYETKVYSLPGTLSISELEKKSRNYPFPNPANKYITIPYELNKNEITNLEIYNTKGELVNKRKINGNLNHIKLNIENLEKGMYIYKYNNISNRFVVN